LKWVLWWYVGHSVVNQKGQVAVPSRIRKDFDIESEDRVVVTRVAECSYKVALVSFVVNQTVEEDIRKSKSR